MCFSLSWRWTVNFIGSCFCIHLFTFCFVFSIEFSCTNSFREEGNSLLISLFMVFSNALFENITSNPSSFDLLLDLFLGDSTIVSLWFSFNIVWKVRKDFSEVSRITQNSFRNFSRTEYTHALNAIDTIIFKWKLNMSKLDGFTTPSKYWDTTISISTWTSTLEQCCCQSNDVHKSVGIINNRFSITIGISRDFPSLYLSKAMGIINSALM